MSAAAGLPLWAAVIVAVLLAGGALVTLIGSVGLARLPSFYDRIHAPSLGATLGSGMILVASMLFFTLAGGRAVVQEILIIVFVTVTTPVTLMLLGRAALHRDRTEGNPGVPPAIRRQQDAGNAPDAE